MPPLSLPDAVPADVAVVVGIVVVVGPPPLQTLPVAQQVADRLGQRAARKRLLSLIGSDRSSLSASGSGSSWHPASTPRTRAE